MGKKEKKKKKEERIERKENNLQRESRIRTPFAELLDSMHAKCLGMSTQNASFSCNLGN